MAEQQDFEAVFRVFDQDGSGAVEVGELEAMVRAVGGKRSGEQIRELLNELDYDLNGKLTYSEFARLCAELFSPGE
ncbi:EF-hand domain-containing protein [Nocardia sp. NPDC004068]|uniref:EF-hand domain-containing protein n=1 Tax=Nocardia sp. NPDC004068 TaxID=3364303 RepID=UPI003674C7B8